MITPRRTRLLRVPDLAAFQTTLTNLVGTLTLLDARSTFVLVPTRAAGDELRRTCEDRLLTGTCRALILPMIGTRADWYSELAFRLGPEVRVLTAFEREIMLGAVARSLAEAGVPPPFDIRPGLVAEMLALYDSVRRLGRSVADFDRNLRDELEQDRETDRGAEKLLQQTTFLGGAFEGYESRMAAAGAVDEHALRATLAERPLARPIARVVVTIADRIAEPDGLWPADFELLTRLPFLDAIDIVCTEGLLAAGLLERIHGVLPELHEEYVAAAAKSLPTLVTPRLSFGPGAAESVFVHRDREDELAAIARRLKAERLPTGVSSRPEPAPLHRTAVVVRRPLPYLYLARDVFGGAGIPFEALDTLPLAAEPFAAALDLVLEAIGSDFTRASVLALARSPHFQLAKDDAVSQTTAAALDHALAAARYLGGFSRLEQLAHEWTSVEVPSSRDARRQKIAAPAAHALVEALRPLVPLLERGPIVRHIETLLQWLGRYDRPPREDEPMLSRRLRVRAAVLGALVSLADAYRRHDAAATADVWELSSAIRRWLGAQTFATATGEPGVQIVDAQAARYGAFDDVQLVGLIDGDWPERIRRSVLYPASLLALLEPMPVNPDPSARERDALNAARAAFRDLLTLARSRVRVSSFVLEHDAVVEPSVLLDEIEGMDLPRVAVEEAPLRVFEAEALALEPLATDALGETPRRWADARIARAAVPVHLFRGDAGAWTLPRVSVSRLERYLDCPFRFFASEVLRLEEQPEDEDTRTPLERGRFLHDLFERFYSEWQRRGHRRIDAASLPEARALFAAICEAALATLSPPEAALERARLLGTAVSPGIAHRVFVMEAERPVAVIERLLEFPLQGDFRFRALDGRERTVTLSAKTDRIDLLADGTMRVIDYKSKKTPELKIALQLPIYSLCARDTLEKQRGRRWTLAEALYLSFEGEKAIVPLRARGRSVDDLLGDAQDRLLATLDRIAEGRFPAQPSKRSLCVTCPYTTVCRLEYAEEPAVATESSVPATDAEAVAEAATARRRGSDHE